MAKLSKDAYDEQLELMLREWSETARWLRETGQRAVILFEGRDAAGKGGAIDMIRGSVSPRQCHAVALESPTDREKTLWYFQRYVPFLPAAGEITLFDRSWYNRAGVERVMGFCTRAQTKSFLKAVPDFERALVDDGILLFKYWLCCDQEEQEKRFAERLEDPTKRYKLSSIDIAARGKYDAYTKARDAMLKATHSKTAPWTLVDFNQQRRGRLTLFRDLLDRLPDTKVAPTKIDWPELSHAPFEESFKVLKPIKSIEV
jgi:polyphosphate kinase